jgi:C-terminal processing protease CtpA/Prc
VVSLSPALAEDIGADNSISGVAVLEVGPASAAARLGLRAGDVVRSLNDSEIATVAQLMAFRTKPFTPWRIIIFRAGQNRAILQPSGANFSP